MDMPYLNELKSKIVRCAEAGALAAGCTMEYGNYENSYHNMITNNTLSNVFNKNIQHLGVDIDDSERETMGSMDMGNVSQVVPAINPFYEITDGKKMSAHTIEFRECTKTETGYQAMMTMIEALIRTAYDVITDDALLQSIKEEFKNIPTVSK